MSDVEPKGDAATANSDPVTGGEESPGNVNYDPAGVTVDEDDEPDLARRDIGESGRSLA